MGETPSSQTVSTPLQQIAERARQMPEVALTTLAHHIDIEMLKEAYRRTRKDGAVGGDGQTADAYAEQLGVRLVSLLARFQAGTSVTPPVRRVMIPKAGGRSTRPIGIPTVEDKVLQRAVAMVLGAVYEQDFRRCAYGFRPGRSAHQALQDLQRRLMMGGGWVYEVDIQGFFDTLDHGDLRCCLDRRVRDGVLRRTIDKWLKAGVFDRGQVTHPEVGTPQGGVLSPLLANIYLHEVLDVWFEDVVAPRLKGPACLIRYADDVIIVCGREDDARYVATVVPKRFEHDALTLHPEKTRLRPFRRPRPLAGLTGVAGERVPGSFDFLGLTHGWRRSRRGYWVVGQTTAKGSLSRALTRVNDWCRAHRHEGSRCNRAVSASNCGGTTGIMGSPATWPRSSGSILRCNAAGTSGCVDGHHALG